MQTDKWSETNSETSQCCCIVISDLLESCSNNQIWGLELIDYFSIAIQKGPCSMRYREPTGTGTSVQPDLWTQKFTNSITDQIPSCISIASLLSIKSCKLCVNLFVPPFRLLFHCIFLSNFSQEMMLPRGGKQHKNEKQHWERLGQYTREASSLTIQVINSKQQSSHKSSSSLHLPH